MTDEMEIRILDESRFMVEHKCTVRRVAREFQVGKSTVYQDVTERLGTLNHELYVAVADVLRVNREERSLRGGQAVARRFRMLQGIR